MRPQPSRPQQTASARLLPQNAPSRHLLILCNVVRTETDKAIHDLKREVQSLRAKLGNSDKKQKSKPTKSAKKPADQNFQRRSGKAAQNDSASNKKGGRQHVPGNATTAAGSKPKKRRSSIKSGGKGRAASSKKLN